MSVTDDKSSRPAAMQNPRDSMKSTWRLDGNRSSWNIYHWTFEALSMHPSTMGVEPPVHKKDEKIPYLPNWQQQRWVITWALVPLVLQQLYAHYAGKNFNWIATVVFYSIFLKVIAIRELNVLRALGDQYGFLDGDKHARDEVPDHSVGKVFASLFTTSTLRPLVFVFLLYKQEELPFSANWLWLPFEIGIYGVAVDFWFYWYHRLMHSNDNLWKFHRTHHLTKHPNPLLTLYADSEQEFFDIIGIPFLALGTMKLMGFPMGFYEWWICHEFVIYTEILGHSGLRMHAAPPSPLHWLLTLFQADLVIEDHDLHHRKGWKKSHNYGKQTRVWDRLFGTCTDRIESNEANVDYNNAVSLPLW